MKKTLITALTLLFTLSVYGQERIIPKIDEVKIDGFLKEWHKVEAIQFSSNDTLMGRRVIRSEFERINDIVVTIKLGWNDAGLYAAIDWLDDVIDTEKINRERFLWKHPDGRNRDRMYYFDNLALRLYQEDSYYYGIWVNPSEQFPFQWNALRNGPRGTDFESLEPPVVKATGVQSNRYFIEIFWPWDFLKQYPNSGDRIDIAFIIGDGDYPSMPMEKREPIINYIGTGRITFLFKD